MKLHTAKRQAKIAKHWRYFDRLSASNIELSESACSYPIERLSLDIPAELQYDTLKVGDCRGLAARRS
jgi:hypothetical protein